MLDNMARGLRWLLAFGVALVLTALFQPFLDHFLESIGWFKAPGVAVATAVNWLERLVGVTAFPWVAASVFGLAAGAWLDSILRRLDGRYPMGKKAKARALAPDLQMLALQIDQATRGIYPVTGRFPGLFSEVEIAISNLVALGFTKEDFEPGQVSPDRALKRVAAQFKFLAPLLRNGDIDKAKAIAPKVMLVD
jgi:hypothetical protein